MEILLNRRDMVKKNLIRLSESLQKLHDKELEQLHEDFRDASVLRFKFCVDTFWKLLKEYLDKKIKVKVEMPSPRKVFRMCADNGLITNEEFNLLSSAIEDRNLTSHTYNQELAEKMSKNIPSYHAVMSNIVERLEF